MKALSYLFLTSIKNAFLQLLKKPVLIIIYSLLLVVMIFAMLPGSSAFTENYMDRTVLLRAISFGVFGFITYTNISKGLKQGSTFFAMADVNMLFTSPIRPQSVLLYGVVRQMGMSAMTTLFLCFQIPNMRNMLHLTGTGVFAVISGWFIIMLSSQVVSLCTYSLTAPHPMRRKMGNYVVYGLITVVIGGLAAYLLSRGGEVESVLDYFGLPFIDFVPLVGWVNAYVMGIITGDIGKSLLFLLLLLFFPALGIALVRRTEADYYEDVLQATERTYTTKQAIKDGKMSAKSLHENVRAGKSGISGKGQGASIFFYRHLTEQRRTGMFILDKGSLLIIAGAAIGGFVLRNLTQKGDFTPFISALAAFCILSYILYFLTVSGKFTQELTRPFIYLVPAPEILKLFYSNLASVLKSFVEGLIAFTIITILAGLPWWYIPMATLAYASLSQLYISMSIMTQRILGDSNSKVLSTILYLFSASVLIIPGAAIFGVLQAVFYFAGQQFLFVAYLAVIIYNAGVSTLVLWLGKGILREVNL